MTAPIDRRNIMSSRAVIPVWTSLVAMLAGVQLIVPLTDVGQAEVGSEVALFWLVVIAASLCVVTAFAVLCRAWADDTAELGLIGAFFMAVSVLPLVHGITTPGVLVGANEATMTSVLWAGPMAVAASVPMLIPRRTAMPILQRWRVWVGANVGLQFGISALLLVVPTALPLAPMGSLSARILAAAVFAACLALSQRHVRLYRISQNPMSLAVSGAYVLVASSVLVWVNDSPMSLGFWLAHVFDIAGVFLGTVVGFVAYRRGQLDRLILKPLVARDPLDALELGLEPVVRRFVADLHDKDEVTHEHVKRTAELAIRLAQACGMSGTDLRTTGIAALLHDVGKLEIDDAVLNKPGGLTDAEFDHIKTHAVIGERLLTASDGLAHIGPIVKQHHERVDGRGYPNGVMGADIHPMAKIIAVCDAFDAMAHTRQYREGMGIERALGILQEHAGSQWDSFVVANMVHLVRTDGVPAAPTVLADVGRSASSCCGDVMAELAAS